MNYEEDIKERKKEKKEKEKIKNMKQRNYNNNNNNSQVNTFICRSNVCIRIGDIDHITSQNTRPLIQILFSFFDSFHAANHSDLMEVRLKYLEKNIRK